MRDREKERSVVGRPERDRLTETDIRQTITDNSKWGWRLGWGGGWGEGKEKNMQFISRSTCVDRTSLSPEIDFYFIF